MYKIVGILCILAGCVGFGRARVKQEKDRIRYLREWIYVIHRIQDEISYGKYTLPEICRLLADSDDIWSAPYFDEIYIKMMQGNGIGLQEAWSSQMKACLQNLPLQEEEKDIIMKLPACLGSQEETRQAMHLDRPMELLTRKCRQAEDVYENRAKMIHSISILAGMLLSILLL